MDRQAYHLLLEGTNYEVGRTLGAICKQNPEFASAMTNKEPFLDSTEEKKMYQLFDEFCPGLNEEISGFAEELGIPATQVLFYAMTYLRPGCSQIALLPSKSVNGHTILARNYEFSDKMEELLLSTTKIKGKYAHISSSIMQFGRGDGLNEHGLAVSQTSAGMPVGNFEYARKPAIIGLQFWAVIRSVLENCKDVGEAIEWTTKMPIAYNMNLMVADKSGRAALIETLNGVKAVKRIDGQTKDQFLCSTNHVHLPELEAGEPLRMKNSLKRYALICDTINEKEKLSAEDLKQLLKGKFPEGLCCHFYDEFFGTLRSMLFDVNDGTLDLCFGSPQNNQWYRFRIDDPVSQEAYPVFLVREKAPEDFFSMI